MSPLRWLLETRLGRSCVVLLGLLLVVYLLVVDYYSLIWTRHFRNVPHVIRAPSQDLTSDSLAEYFLDQQDEVFNGSRTVPYFSNNDSKTIPDPIIYDPRPVPIVAMNDSKLVPDLAINDSKTVLDPCAVTCGPGEPCEYSSEVDLRIIVLTYNRPRSLHCNLMHIAQLKTLGHRIGVDVWVDRPAEDRQAVDNLTLRVFKQFRDRWTLGQLCLHVQPRHAGVTSQWINAWRPRSNSSELALFLEDDVDVSKLAYRWIKAVHKHFNGRPDITGYTLSEENVKVARGPRRTVTGPASDSVFLYQLLSTWAFIAKPKPWRDFQDWFHKKRRSDPDFRPYVPHLRPTQWYRGFESRGREDTMWEMWFIYYCNEHGLYTLYPNLVTLTGRKNVLLQTNRQEDGLHFRHNSSSVLRYTPTYHRNLLTEWNSTFDQFPEKVARYNFSGDLV